MDGLIDMTGTQLDDGVALSLALDEHAAGERRTAVPLRRRRVEQGPQGDPAT